MKQYNELGQRIIDEGVMVHNERTDTNCLTIINADLEYDVGSGKFPLCTNRKSFWKAAVAELLGYIRGYDNAADFRAVGTPTWNANANENKAWLNNPHRKGEDDMGRVYGVQGRDWKTHNGKSLDQLKKIVDNLSRGIDDRGEILLFLNPGETEIGCLRPCMYSHHFSLLDGTLYLNSTQRSVDVPLGLNFNMVQVYVFLALMAQITGNKAGVAYHKLINTHIYENQIELFKTQIAREPFELPEFRINPDIKTLEDLETWVTLDDFEVIGYEHHEAIKYPFTV